MTTTNRDLSDWEYEVSCWDRQPEVEGYERWGEENDSPAIAILAASYLFSRLGSGTIWAEQVRRLVESLEPWQRVELARITRGDAACPSYEAWSAMQPCMVSCPDNCDRCYHD